MAVNTQFLQVLYPMECRSRNHGEYVSKFTLHERLEREEKPAVRPIHIDRCVTILIEIDLSF